MPALYTVWFRYQQALRWTGHVRRRKYIVPRQLSSCAEQEARAAAASLGAVAALLPPLLLVLGPRWTASLCLAVAQGACFLTLLHLRWSLA